MDTRKLKHFLALCEQGSFHKAADFVHLSQSAISRSIQSLEEELGVRLFDRVGHKTQLTATGRSVAARARQLVLEEKELQRELVLLRNGDYGEIMVGASPTPASICLCPCLIEFAHRRPKVKVNVSLGRTPELLEKLRGEKLDVAVVDATDISNPTGLDIEPLATLEGNFLCRKGHPLLKKKKLTFHDLLDYPIACSSVSDSFSKRLVSVYGAEAHADRLITYRCDSYEIQKEIVLHSDVILMCTLAAMRKEIQSGRLVSMNIECNRVAGSYSIARLSGRLSWPALDHLMSEISKSFRA